MLSSHEQLALQVFRPKTRIEEDGTVEGYASLFGEIDAARDMVMPGAFARTLKAAASAACRCCSSTTRPSRSACGSSFTRTCAGCVRADGSFPTWRGRASYRAGARRRGRRALDRLPHREGAHRSGEPRAQADRRRPLGDFHRHFPAARGSARPRQGLGLLPAEPRAGARRAGVGEGGFVTRDYTNVQVHSRGRVMTPTRGALGLAKVAPTRGG